MYECMLFQTFFFQHLQRQFYDINIDSLFSFVSSTQMSKKISYF